MTPNASRRPADDGCDTTGVPPVGALFDWDGGRWRVTGWLRELPEPTFDDVDEPWIREFLLEIRAETVARETAPRMSWNEVAGRWTFWAQLEPNKRWEWVARESATHVSGAGTCGCIAPVAEITVTGMVDWPDELLEDAERRARMHIGQVVA